MSVQTAPANAVPAARHADPLLARAWDVLEAVPELGAALPPTAIGKDWRPSVRWFGWTPSRTGLRVSLGGLAGISVGWVEGLEVNVLSLVAGLDIRRPALKLPGWGRIGMPAAGA